MEENQNNVSVDNQEKTKFCKYCGTKIHEDAVICTNCGRQVEELKGTQGQPQVIVNNTNTNTNTNVNTNVGTGNYGNPKNKWVALILCFFLGWLGAHKFYEGKIGMGIIYLFTGGLLGFGVVIDFIILLFKPNPYYI